MNKPNPKYWRTYERFSVLADSKRELVMDYPEDEQKLYAEADTLDRLASWVFKLAWLNPNEKQKVQIT